MSDDSEEVQSALEYLEMLKEGNMFVGKESFLEQLTRLAKQGVHPLEVFQSMRKPVQEEKMPAVLHSFDIEGIARYIAEKECKQVVSMT
mmetsp:Transcript_18398/g.21404  ORF Transcript_18398/g.21404 Transcript_18398/m.21404 type:complete len:89 (+) Transcript_18398:70-336(+)